MSQIHLGQGVKAWPMSDLKSMMAVHLLVSREDVKVRLQQDWQQHIDPHLRYLQEDLRFISALQVNGCCAPLYELQILSVWEEEIHIVFAAYKAHIQRGYTPLKNMCEGQLYLLYTAENALHIWPVKTSPSESLSEYSNCFLPGVNTTQSWELKTII